MKNNLLDNGNIAAHTECPFRERCEIKKVGQCKHLGKEHSVEFSCAAARLFNKLQKV